MPDIPHLFFGLISVFCILFSSLLVIWTQATSRLYEIVLYCFISATAQVCLIGFVLSATGHLNQLQYWALISLVGCAVMMIVAVPRRSGQSPNLRGLFKESGLGWQDMRSALNHPSAFIIIPMLITTLFLAAVHVVAVFLLAPDTVDAMTYHLARVAYYLQHNNLSYFDANYWAQVVHPKNSTLLFLYTFLLTDLNENFTQLVQFAAFWVAAFAVFGISRRVGVNAHWSLVSALIFSLVIEVQMQSITVQNDMLLTAYVGCSTYFLFAFRETGSRRHLAWAATAIGIALGVKASMLLILPSLVLLFFYTVTFTKGGKSQFIHYHGFFLMALLLALLLFALPSGYLENYRIFGHPTGAEAIVRIHSFQAEPVSNILRFGTKNLLRYAVEFISLDGLPPIEPVNHLHRWGKQLAQSVIGFLGINLEDRNGVRINSPPFSYDKKPAAHEDMSYWGVLGFGLLWPVVVLLSLGILKSTAGRVLAVATILFLFCQAYSGPYDVWRGRYFLVAALFAAPCVGTVLARGRIPLFYGYVVFLCLLGCLSAISAVWLRLVGPVPITQLNVPFVESFLNQDRLAQLTRQRRSYYEPLRRFEQIVPRDATVSVWLGEDYYEYALFGDHMTRRIIPVNSFWSGPQEIPEDSDYLLYSRGFPGADSADIFLGEDWYLRELDSSSPNGP